ncbi:SdpI family protein [Flavobacterium longum]|uniref:SdpI family protein n=1 Tax=Flavobacterium longum TaxID=1299340 RepID=UPI0039ED77F6
MHFTLIFLLAFSIVWKLFPPKKPNNLYGYQLGSAKKSIEHWRVANKYAANYMIILYGITLILSYIFANQNYEGHIWILFTFFSGAILIYMLIENKLKKINESTSGNSLHKKLP